MTSPDLIRPRAFGVLFEDFDIWSVGSFHRADWAWPQEYIKPLSAALKRKQIEVDRKAHPLETLQLVTLHFGGSMEPRNIDGENRFKGRLNFANAGDVIYSKIDIRNGAIGIVPQSMPCVAVSSEYHVYEVRPDVALPKYIQLLFRTGNFRQTINSMISGASGRKRVQPSQIESLQVPLPPLSVQRAIVAHWQRTQKEVRIAKERAKQCKANIDESIYKDLGLKPLELDIPPKSFAVMWEDFLRWGVSYNQAAQNGVDITKGEYPVIHLGAILELVQYGTSEKANSRGEGTPVLRINNIKNGVVDTSDLKHIQLREEVLQSLLLRAGDILVIRTSGSRDLVGTCAAFHEFGEYVFASYLIRLRLYSNKANADFVSWFINSAFGRQQVDAVSRQIMMNNINSEELRGLLIPLPPLDVQRAIALRIKEGRAEIAREFDNAKRKASEAEAEIEALILGTKKLGEI